MIPRYLKVETLSIGTPLIFSSVFGNFDLILDFRVVFDVVGGSSGSTQFKIMVLDEEFLNANFPGSSMGQNPQI